MAKSTKIIAALGVAGALGVAALPMASYADDVQEIIDNISVTVTPTCSFKTQGSNGASAAAASYAGTVLPGEVVSFNNDGKHVFNVACNDKDGFTVKAVATGLTGKDGETALVSPHHTIDFIASNSYDANDAGTAVDGKWTATVDTTGTSSDYVLTDGVTTGSAAEIVKKNTAADNSGVEFTVTYKAYTGLSTQAGTYTGTVKYTLAAN